MSEKPPAMPDVKKTLLSMERPYTDTEFWRGAVRSAMAQEEFVRAELLKGVSAKMAFLKKTFPDAVINETSLTFIDMTAPPEARRQRSFGDFMSTRYKPFKSLDEATQAEVKRSVSLILSKRRDAENALDGYEVDDFTSRMISSLRLRQGKKYFNDKVVEMMESIVGAYPINEEYHVRISVNPIDVFMKSAGQLWGAISCENLRGMCKYGMMSDISHYNAVAFVEDKTGKPQARIMIRWCNPEEDPNKADVGIESVFYISGTGKGNKIYLTMLQQKSEEIVEGSGVFGFDVYRFLYELFRSKNLFTYGTRGTCKTPYRYEGYSDIMGDSDRNIYYKAMEYPLKFKGGKRSKLDQLLEMGTEGRMTALRDEFRVPKESRKLSEADIIQVLDSLSVSQGVLEMLLRNVTKELMILVFDRYDSSIDPFKLEASLSAFDYAAKHSKNSTLYSLIRDGRDGREVKSTDYDAKFLFDLMSATKDMPWQIPVKNYAYAARACVFWFVDLIKTSCPGRIEAGIGAIGIQVLLRTFRMMQQLGLTIDLVGRKNVDAIRESNRVSVIGSLLAYLDNAAKNSGGANSYFVSAFKSIAEKYTELYMYSQSIIDEWFKIKHTLGDQCSACGVDEGTDEPKMFKITDRGTSRSISLTLCSQCAAKIFVVWCDDEKKYARRLRMIYFYYAIRNYAPESYCEDFSKSKLRKRVQETGDIALNKFAKGIFEQRSFGDKYLVEYIGKRARGSPPGTISR